ncbi:hypothetical protein [Nostoc sp. FACHB-110]|uniref:hypothetical protein n=1 Tax=Nostoc sp. FACHB-110 TaxID=2692834 RepID=UPI001689180E|nr:hypothetical protein [Nostoc sp. FACHB-110]MBD2436666.1 hypothetical protein [Nostoc sp. FACHB-110]
MLQTKLMSYMNDKKLSHAQYYTYEARTKNVEWLHRTIELLHQQPELSAYEDTEESFTNETIEVAKKLLELIDTKQPNSQDISELYHLLKFYKGVRNYDWDHICSYVEKWHWATNIWDSFAGMLELDVWKTPKFNLYSISTVLIAEGKFIRQSSSVGSYGHLCLQLEPKPDNKNIQIIWQINDERTITSDYIPVIFEGIIDGIFDYFHKSNIALAAMKIIINNGSYHEVDSREIDYRIAANIALRNALKNAELSPLKFL